MKNKMMMHRRKLLQVMGVYQSFSMLKSIRANTHSPKAWGPDYAKYKGSKVVISIPAHPHYFAMMKLLPFFTKETGIRVEVERMDSKNIKAKQMLEMGKAVGDFDLVSYVAMWKTEYVKKKLLHNLEPFFGDQSLMDPNYDLKDIVPIYLENIGMVGGFKGYLGGKGSSLYGMPYGAETSILAYRRDIFDRFKLSPPKTYDELKWILPVIKDKTHQGSMTSRGLMGHQCVHAWLLHLSPLGGRVFDNQWEPAFTNQSAVDALDTLKLIVETGPKDIPYYDQGDMIASFIKGQASMYLDSSLIFSLIEQNASSKFAQNVGYALHPKGVVNSSETGGLGLGIAQNSRNPEGAFLLLQWLTGKKQDQMVCQFGGVPTRLSTLSDPAMQRRFPQFKLLKEQLTFANPDWRPIIAQWDQINTEFLGKAIYAAITKKEDSKEALMNVMPNVRKIMVDGGYLQGST